MTDTARQDALLWEHLEARRQAVEQALVEFAVTVPVLARLLEHLPPEVQEEQNRASREHQRLALLDGDWEPFVADLKTQGTAYAQLSVEFQHWFPVLSVFRRTLLADLDLDDDTRGVLEALDRYVDVSMANLGQVYIDTKESLVRRAEERLARHVRDLERSNRELDEFAYVASHDLKSPLQDVRNLTEWLVEDLGDDLPDAARRHVALLQERVRRMERLLDDLLEYSRVGRGDDRATTFTLAEVVDEVAALVCAGSDFEVRVEGPDVTITSPRAPLEKVLRNLISNAIKHHDAERGTIWVRAAPRDRWLEVSVADDGPGIPEAFRERVFRMFQTLRSRDAVEGSGVGLAIVKKSVERFGGSVRISGGARGATVTFTWPLVVDPEPR